MASRRAAAPPGLRSEARATREGAAPRRPDGERESRHERRQPGELRAAPPRRAGGGGGRGGHLPVPLLPAAGARLPVLRDRHAPSPAPARPPPRPPPGPLSRPPPPPAPA